MVERRAIHARDFGNRGLGDPQGEHGVFCPTPQWGIFQRLYEHDSRGRALGAQSRNDHRYLKLLALILS